MIMASRACVRIKTSLDRLIGKLIDAGLCNDQNFTMIRSSGRRHEVTFGGAEYVAIALKDIDYPDLYRELDAARSFTMKLLDGALLQLMYSFAGDRLLQHRLAFYPSPGLLPFSDDPDGYLGDDSFIDIIRRRIVPFPLRFDFDDRQGIPIDVVHPRSHLSLGDVKNCRIPVTAPLAPRQFVEFVLRHFYQSSEHDFVSGLPPHDQGFGSTITENESRLMHMVVPSVMGA